MAIRANGKAFGRAADSKRPFRLFQLEFYLTVHQKTHPTVKLQILKCNISYSANPFWLPSSAIKIVESKRKLGPPHLDWYP